MGLPNVDPVYTRDPRFLPVTLGATANQKSDGSGTIGTDMFFLGTAGANAGSFWNRVRFTPVQTAAATGTATVATCLRVFMSTQSSGATTSSNTVLIGEVTAPIVTAGSSTTAAAVFEIGIGFPVPAGYSLLVAQAVAPAANTAWQAIGLGGDY